MNNHWEKFSRAIRFWKLQRIMWSEFSWIQEKLLSRWRTLWTFQHASDYKVPWFPRHSPQLEPSWPHKGLAAPQHISAKPLCGYSGPAACPGGLFQLGVPLVSQKAWNTLTWWTDKIWNEEEWMWSPAFLLIIGKILSNLSFSAVKWKRKKPYLWYNMLRNISSFSGFFFQINRICRDSHVCTHIPWSLKII